MENLCDNNEHNISVKIFDVPHNKIRGHVGQITNQIAVLWCHFARFLLWYPLSYQVFNNNNKERTTLTRRLTCSKTGQAFLLKGNFIRQVCFNEDVNNVIHKTKHTEKVEISRKTDFVRNPKNAFSEKLLQILKVVLSVKLISFYAPFFYFDILVHILLNNVSQCCNRKFPSISHISGFGAKI